MVTIDLGVLSEEPPEPVSRGIPPGTRRAVAVAVCVALAGGLLTASGRAGEDAPPGVRVPAAESDVYFTDGDRLYVAGPEVGERTLTAYTVPGGERLWQQPIESRFTVIGVIGATDDTLLVMVQNRDNMQQALALDPDTGATRWNRQLGWPMFTEAGTTVFGLGSDGQELPVVWEAVRASTGERLWRREFPAQAYWTPLPEDAGRALVSLPDQHAEVWDLVENRMVSSARLPENAGVSMDADRALAMTQTFDRMQVVAYALPGLERLWEHSYEDGLRLGMCGPEVLCAGTDLEDRARVLDPDTGEALWESDEYSWLTRAGPVLLAGGPVRTPGVGAFHSNDVSLLAAGMRTGRTIRDFGRWQLIDSRTTPEARSTVVVAHFASVPGPARATIAELDLTTMTIRVIVQVSAAEHQCSADHDVLFCRFQDGAIGMWDLSAAR